MQLLLIWCAYDMMYIQNLPNHSGKYSFYMEGIT